MLKIEKDYHIYNIKVIKEDEYYLYFDFYNNCYSSECFTLNILLSTPDNADQVGIENIRHCNIENMVDKDNIEFLRYKVSLKYLNHILSKSIYSKIILKMKSDIPNTGSKLVISGSYFLN